MTGKGASQSSVVGCVMGLLEAACAHDLEQFGERPHSQGHFACASSQLGRPDADDGTARRRACRVGTRCGLGGFQAGRAVVLGEVWMSPRRRCSRR